MWSGGQLCLQDWSQGDPHQDDHQDDHDDDDQDDDHNDQDDHHNDHDDDGPDDPDDLDDDHDDEDCQKKVEKLDLQKTEYALFPSLIHQVGGKSHHC